MRYIVLLFVAAPPNLSGLNSNRYSWAVIAGNGHYFWKPAISRNNEIVISANDNNAGPSGLQKAYRSMLSNSLQ